MTKFKRPTKRQDAATFEQWRDVPVGTDVRVMKDDGSTLTTKTRSAPWLLGHGAPVIMVDGITGGYDLHRLRKVPQ